VIYDELVSETLIEPRPEQRADEPPPGGEVAELPAPGHDAGACSVCQAWLAHVREAEGA
jgi:hypothetical protein